MRQRIIFKSVQPYVSVLAVLIVAGVLVAAIYYTLFSLPWIAFLSGILAAAMLGMVSRASRAEWIITRRDAKIASLQKKLAHETKLRRDIEQSLAAVTAQAQNSNVTANVTAPITSVQNSGSYTETPTQPAPVRDAEEKIEIARILEAIEQNEFCLYCQRISPLADRQNQASHYEILIRLIEEEEGMTPPGAFFPAIEKYGLMPRLDRWVVEHVVAWIAQHKNDLKSHAGSIFFINMAPATLGDRDFPAFVRDLLTSHHLPADLLCFEITETEFSLQRENVLVFVQQAKIHKFNVAIGNFGRNNVNLAQLRELGLDFIKIDGNLILGILRNATDLALIAGIADAARKIKLKTIAEYVESEPCELRLQEIGIDFAQGFGISKPQPLSEII
jgi:EAL domain-containing protein (putative c-di-GMP-specific phosphodiesterase class I)